MVKVSVLCAKYSGTIRHGTNPLLLPSRRLGRREPQVEESLRRE